MSRDGRVFDSCPRVLAAWTELVARWRVGVLVAAALLTALALFACVRSLGISTDTVDMLSPEVPFRQHAAAFNEAFPDLKNNIVAVIDAPTAERADATAEWLAERLRDSDTIRDIYVPGGGFVRRHALLYLKPEALADLVDRLAGAEPLLAQLARDPSLRGLADLIALAAEQGGEAPMAGFDRLLDEMAVSAEALAAGRPRNLSWQALLAPEDGDGGGEGGAAAERFSQTRRFVILQPRLQFDRLKPAARAIAEVRTLAERQEVRSRGTVSVRLTGEAVIEHQEMETVEAGGILAALLSFVAVAAILMIGLRAPRLLAASLLTLVAGLIWTAGLAAVVVGDLNLISVAFAVLFVGLGIDFCIHYALRYRETVDSTVAEAIVTAARGIGCALLLSALCAAIGFLSFLPTAYKGLAELGLISGLGMFVAALASLTLLPALVATWSPRRGFSETSTTISRQQARLLRHHRGVLLAAAVIGVGAAVLAPRIHFDFNPMNLRDPDSSSIQTFDDLAADAETTPYVVNVLAGDLPAARDLAERFRSAPGFGAVRTLASFVPGQQEEKLAILGDAAFFLAPILASSEPLPPPGAEARTQAYERLITALRTLRGGAGDLAAAADRLLEALGRQGKSPDLEGLEARWIGYLPRTLGFLREALTVDRVAPGDLPESLRIRWIAQDGRARVDVQPPEAILENGAIQAFAERALQVSERATGAPIIIYGASMAVSEAFVEATTYASLGILLLLAVLLRRGADILLMLVPMVLAALLTLATAVLLGIPLNFANVIVLPLLLGLGVSSGVHLVLRARQGSGTEQVLVSSTPRAVLLSGLTTLASFGTLVVSDHRGMSSMGALLTIAVAYTLLAMLVVLPALLAEIERRRHA